MISIHSTPNPTNPKSSDHSKPTFLSILKNGARQPPRPILRNHIRDSRKARRNASPCSPTREHTRLRLLAGPDKAHRVLRNFHIEIKRPEHPNLPGGPQRLPLMFRFLAKTRRHLLSARARGLSSRSLRVSFELPSSMYRDLGRLLFLDSEQEVRVRGQKVKLSQFI